ncbi:MAG TPA: hypothetical protein VFT91_10475, partial [Dehalococcoidia bacterium]|nr:hypothetical protein [Dehalococcoidia bacterium]
GWRMAVLGYCTTVERELRASYRALRDKVAAVRNTESTTLKSLGDAIDALARLVDWLSKSKPVPSGLSALASSLDALKRLNGVRIRAAHPKDQQVSRKEAVWVRQALLTSPSPLIITIVAVRPNQ